MFKIKVDKYITKAGYTYMRSLIDNSISQWLPCLLTNCFIILWTAILLNLLRNGDEDGGV